MLGKSRGKYKIWADLTKNYKSATLIPFCNLTSGQISTQRAL